jgi:hypothetical protein
MMIEFNSHHLPAREGKSFRALGSDLQVLTTLHFQDVSDQSS